MEFLIADTFTNSLGRLTSEEQKAAKNTAFDLQMNPAHPSFQFHRLDKGKDPNFWSVRVNNDVRLIVHRTEKSLLLCYVAHHDDAYRWGEKRKLETHPKTGAAQIVVIKEKVQEIPVYVEKQVPKEATLKSALFAHLSDSELLSYGVPPLDLENVRRATEDNLLDLELPAEAAEALLNLATGVKPKPTAPAPAGADPFQHPDAQRRFRILQNTEELARALDYPWEKWAVFLHPDQRNLVERDFNGPARVSGSAGTGKTIVALHRAVFLTRKNPEARVLLTTFSTSVANALRAKLRYLISNEPRLAERLEVHSMDSIGKRLYESNFGPAHFATGAEIKAILHESAQGVEGNKFSLRFLLTEWEQIVDAWQLNTWDAYRDVARLGRKMRLAEPKRAMLWSIFEEVHQSLAARGRITQSQAFSKLAARTQQTGRVPFDFAIVDEAQDISVAQLKFLAALGANAPNRLFFAGDLGQRIFQQPFSWKALGVDVRGRSLTLKVNYRTSHQIRTQADRLLEPEVSDVDGNTEQRKGTISVFNSDPPDVRTFDSQEEESKEVGKWLKARRADGLAPHEIGIFVRSEAQLDRAGVAAKTAAVPFKILDEGVETATGYASVSTMHLAKGLEFRAVVVMACDDEVIPLQARIEAIADDSDLEEVYNTERHLLYVACTRARDFLLVTGVEPASEFLDDLTGE